MHRVTTQKGLFKTPNLNFKKNAPICCWGFTLLFILVLASDECHCVLCLTTAATFAWWSSKIIPPHLHLHLAHFMYHAASLRTTSDAEKSNLAASYYFKTKSNSACTAFCLNSITKTWIENIWLVSVILLSLKLMSLFKLKSVIKISQIILPGSGLCRFFTTSDRGTIHIL